MMRDAGRSLSIGGLRDVNGMTRSLAFPLSRLKKILMERPRLLPISIARGKTTIDTATHGNKDKIMKLTAMALATVFALSGTAAFAHTYHHRSDANHYRNAYDQYGMSDEQPTFHLRPNNGNPNGNPDGPTTLSGTGDSQWGGSTPGTSGYN
jgi:hypothetical protein